MTAACWRGIVGKGARQSEYRAQMVGASFLLAFAFYQAEINLERLLQSHRGLHAVKTIVITIDVLRTAFPDSICLGLPSPDIACLAWLMTLPTPNSASVFAWFPLTIHAHCSHPFSICGSTLIPCFPGMHPEVVIREYSGGPLVLAVVLGHWQRRGSCGGVVGERGVVNVVGICLVFRCGVVGMCVTWFPACHVAPISCGWGEYLVAVSLGLGWRVGYPEPRNSRERPIHCQR